MGVSFIPGYMQCSLDISLLQLKRTGAGEGRLYVILGLPR